MGHKSTDLFVSTWTTLGSHLSEQSVTILIIFDQECCSMVGRRAETDRHFMSFPSFRPSVYTLNSLNLERANRHLGTSKQTDGKGGGCFVTEKSWLAKTS